MALGSDLKLFGVYSHKMDAFKKTQDNKRIIERLSHIMRYRM